MKHPVIARKQPTQARSRGVVEAILEAAARIFDDRGYELTTTNEVAAVAGVSVGSLYQYFQSKDALITALHERHIEHMLELSNAAFDRAESATLQNALRALVTAALNAHAQRPRLQRLLHIEQRPLEHSAAASRAKQRLLERTRTLLYQHRATLAIEEPNVVAHVLLQQAEALVHAAVLDPIPEATPAAMEQAIAAALWSYLQGFSR